MDSMIKMSGTSKESIEAVKEGILEILNTRADQKTIRLALKAFQKGASVGPVTISGCTLTYNEGSDGPDDYPMVGLAMRPEA